MVISLCVFDADMPRVLFFVDEKKRQPTLGWGGRAGGPWALRPSSKLAFNPSPRPWDYTKSEFELGGHLPGHLGGHLPGQLEAEGSYLGATQGDPFLRAREGGRL